MFYHNVFQRLSEVFDRIKEPIIDLRLHFNYGIDLQACRGTKLDDGVEVPDESDSTDANTNVPSSPKQKEILLPLEADFLYAYSTVPGKQLNCYLLVINFH